MLLREMHKNTFIYLQENQWKDLDQIIDILCQGPLCPTPNSVPASLRYHTAKVLFEELFNAMEEKDFKVEVAEAEKLLRPLITLLQRSTDTLMVNKIWESVIESGLFVV